MRHASEIPPLKIIGLHIVSFHAHYVYVYLPNIAITPLILKITFLLMRTFVLHRMTRD